MRKRNRGFTLIELMIAIAVLSVMAGVLLQSFVISRRLDSKAKKAEIIQDAAKKTMEGLKGYPFAKLELKSGTGGLLDSVEIAGERYDIEPLQKEGEAEKGGIEKGKSGSEAGKSGIEKGKSGSEAGKSGTKADDSTEAEIIPGDREGYLLKREYRIDETSEKADYLIYAEVDWGKYASQDVTAKESALSVNQYQMPNIADVSSFQNIVCDPQTLNPLVFVPEEPDPDNPDSGSPDPDNPDQDNPDAGTQEYRADKLWTLELLDRVNPDEEEAGMSGGDSEEGADEGTNRESEESFTEDQVSRYLFIDISEDGPEKKKNVIVKATAYYTVEDSTVFESKPEAAGPSKYTDAHQLLSASKRIVVDEQSKKSLNRIYVFLPAQDVLEYNRIFVTADAEETYEFYVVAQAQETFDPGSFGSGSGEYIDIREHGAGTSGEKKIELYTNIESKSTAQKEELVSRYEAQKRLYHLTVTVYEADYRHGLADTDPDPGQELLKLESTKSE